MRVIEQEVVEERIVEKIAVAGPSRIHVLAAFAAVYVIWGSTYLGIRLAIDSIPPLLMAGSRFFIAGLFLYVGMRMRGAAAPSLRQWRDSTIIGGLLLLAGNGGVSWAEQTVPSNLAALLIAGTPLWIIVADWLRPAGRRPSAWVFAGLALGFVGVGLIVAGKDSMGHHSIDPHGTLLLLGASICWAIGSVFSRHADQPSRPLTAIGMQMLTGGALLLLSGLALGEGQHFQLQQVSATSAWAFVYLTLAGSMIGFSAYVWLLKVSTPARVSTYAYVNPLIAVFLGRVFLDEALPASALLAAILILGAVGLISQRR